MADPAPKVQPTAERALPRRSIDARSPFARLTELLDGIPPGRPAINLAVGEPQHPIPAFVGSVIAAHVDEFGRYPAGKGTERFRRAASAWLGRRYHLTRPLDPGEEIVVLSGTREGLVFAAIAARNFSRPRPGPPAVLVPNPFYAAYVAGAAAAGCEPIYLAASAANCFLPDVISLDEGVLARTVAVYLASPSNPQGAVASPEYLFELITLARRFDFLVFADECYGEIYSGRPPSGVLELAGAELKNVVAFHSLSKRSNLPGLRVGFAAGDRRFMAAFTELRNVAAPQVPVPAQEVAIAAYGDEAHVAANRRRYAAKFDLADEIIGTRYGYQRPAGGFFLWLNVAAQGGSERAALELWAKAGVRVLPGRYIARDHADGCNPGAEYIRVAMVADLDTTAEALHRLVAVMG
jgi:N-succinyldiaminopimelate aminotransferase